MTLDLTGGAPRSDGRRSLDLIRRPALRYVGFLLVPALVLLAGPAGAETVNCTPITQASLPVSISAQGIYCVTEDLAWAGSGFAISINTNNVVLDLNGHKLGGLSGGAGTLAEGINAFRRQNITIKNGTVRGFFRGIMLWGGATGSPAPGGHVVEDVRADQNTYEGIHVEGRGCVVRNNQVVATGGTTAAGVESARAIYLVGPGNRAINNDVMTVTKRGAGTAYGITFDTGVDDFAVGNRITEADHGIDFLTFAAAGKYRDNLTDDVVTPFLGGTNAGNNN